MTLNSKALKTLVLRATFLACTVAPAVVFAQTPPMQYWRPYDQRGIEMFETPKTDTTPFTGIHVNVGGAFAQHYQAITTSNYLGLYGNPANSTGTLVNIENVPAGKTLTYVDSQNVLTKLTNGFNLAMADLFLDAQVADGIRINVTTYLSARHHEDAWVKNGYLQMDQAKFLGSDFINDAFKYLTIKVGDLEVDYGDQHWRRADGGNEMYNPFVENYIMDEFATEIGGEVYWHDPSGIFVMVGATDGMLNPTVKQANVVDSLTADTNSYNPAYHFKLGFDKQLTPDLRLRLTGSYYTESSTASSTLFSGDRTGSNYFLYLYPMATIATASSGDANSIMADGRFSVIGPGFTEAVNTFMINPFVKFMGLEFFGTFEKASGRKVFETTNRNATQLAADLIYRFGDHAQFWVGGRYNTLKADWAPSSAKNLSDIKTQYGSIPQVTVNREAFSAGWFMTPNVMMKAEYVNQEYVDFPGSSGLASSKALPTSLFADAKFNGIVIEAAVGF